MAIQITVHPGCLPMVLTIEQNRRQTWDAKERSQRQVKRNDVTVLLPRELLLEIFAFYVDSSLVSHEGKTRIEEWQSLVHVCRKWRSVVFQSPRRLNLRLYCTPETPARDTLDVWPALPLIVAGDMTSSGTDNVIAALGQRNRVYQVFLRGLVSWQLEKVLAVMQVPFPWLTEMWLSSHHVETPPVPVIPDIPDSFLDGSAPRLRIFTLDGIPFPGMPKLLSSANHLVKLWLSNIPHSWYIAPEEMAALLSVLSSLRMLSLQFKSFQSLSDLESGTLPLPKRFLLPALEKIRFKGVTEYLEELVTRIDTPKLYYMDITFFNQIDFDTPQLAQFVNRTPKLGKRDHDAHVQFNDNVASVKLRCQTSRSGFSDLLINISCREPDWQLSAIEQVCNSSLQPISTVGVLYIEHEYSQLVWKDDAIENTLWLELLLPFTSMENLYLSKEFAPGIAAALQELVGARITEVLPSLQNIFVEGLDLSGPLQENIGQFIAARRRLSDRPIAIFDWDKDFYMALKSM